MKGHQIYFKKEDKYRCKFEFKSILIQDFFNETRIVPDFVQQNKMLHFKLFLIVRRFKIYACYSSMSNYIVSVRPFMGWLISTMMNDGCKIHPSSIHNNNIQMLTFLEQISDSPSSSNMYKLQ